MPEHLESLATRLFAWVSGVLFVVCLLLQVFDRAGLVPPWGDLGVFLVLGPLMLLVFPGHALVILRLQEATQKVGRDKVRSYRAVWRVFRAAFRCVPVPLRVFSLGYFYLYAPVSWTWLLVEEAKSRGTFPVFYGFGLVLGAFFLLQFLFFAYWVPRGSQIAAVLEE